MLSQMLRRLYQPLNIQPTSIIPHLLPPQPWKGSVTVLRSNHCRIAEQHWQALRAVNPPLNQFSQETEFNYWRYRETLILEGHTLIPVKAKEWVFQAFCLKCFQSLVILLLLLKDSFGQTFSLSFSHFIHSLLPKEYLHCCSFLCLVNELLVSKLLPYLTSQAYQAFDQFLWTIKLFLEG